MTVNPDKSIYPLSRLAVGGSFFVGDGDPEKMRTVCENATRILAPKMFSCVYTERDPVHGIKGVRVWRTL